MKLLEELKKDNGTVYVTLHEDTELNAIVDVWNGFYGKVENFNKALLRVTELIEKNKYPYWLADLRKLEGPFNSSSDLIINEVTPRVLKAGLKKEAIVLPQNFFAELSAKQTSEKLGELQLRMFDSIEEARQWLAESN